MSPGALKISLLIFKSKYTTFYYMFL